MAVRTAPQGNRRLLDVLTVLFHAAMEKRYSLRVFVISVRDGYNPIGSVRQMWIIAQCSSCVI